MQCCKPMHHRSHARVTYDYLNVNRYKCLMTWCRVKVYWFLDYNVKMLLFIIPWILLTSILVEGWQMNTCHNSGYRRYGYIHHIIMNSDWYRSIEKGTTPAALLKKIRWLATNIWQIKVLPWIRNQLPYLGKREWHAVATLLSEREDSWPCTSKFIRVWILFVYSQLLEMHALLPFNYGSMHPCRHTYIQYVD